MKFSAPMATALFASGALSHLVEVPAKVAREPPTLVERQAATITEVLNSVGSGIGELDTAVKAFEGEAGPVEEAAESLTSTINDGTETVNGSEDLALADALALQSPVEDLTSQAEGLKNDLVDKRSAIQDAGECDTTRTQISNIQTASQELIDAVVAKVPEDAQSIAQDLAQGLLDVLDETASAFSEENCASSGGGGDGGGDGGSPPTETSDAGSATSAPGSPATSDAESATGSVSATGSEATPAPTVPGGSSPSTPGLPTPTAPSNGTGTDSPIGIPPTGAAGMLTPAGALAFGIAAALL